MDEEQRAWLEGTISAHSFILQNICAMLIAESDDPKCCDNFACPLPIVARWTPIKSLLRSSMGRLTFSAFGSWCRRALIRNLGKLRSADAQRPGAAAPGLGHDLANALFLRRRERLFGVAGHYATTFREGR